MRSGILMTICFMVLPVSVAVAADDLPLGNALEEPAASSGAKPTQAKSAPKNPGQRNPARHPPVTATRGLPAEESRFPTSQPPIANPYGPPNQPRFNQPQRNNNSMPLFQSTIPATPVAPYMPGAPGAATTRVNPSQPRLPEAQPNYIQPHPGSSTSRPAVESDPEMQRLNSEDRQLERDTRMAGQQIRSTPPSQRKELRKKLSELVAEHFDVRQARRELHLKHLEEELKRLSTLVKKRVELREQIINRRMSELLGEPDDLGF